MKNATTSRLDHPQIHYALLNTAKKLKTYNGQFQLSNILRASSWSSQRTGSFSSTWNQVQDVSRPEPLKERLQTAQGHKIF
jgi:hypothetical protein